MATKNNDGIHSSGVTPMRYFASALLLLIFSTSAVPQQHAPLAKTAPLPQKISSKILAAKTAFFEDRTGVHWN
jgi:hypothetical protein